MRVNDQQFGWQNNFDGEILAMSINGHGDINTVLTSRWYYGYNHKTGQYDKERR